MDLTAVMLGVAWMELPARLGHIFYFIVLPILLLAGIGWGIQRTLGLDMLTLRRLNFYFVIPGVIYVSLVQSRITGTEVLAVVLFTLGVQAVLGALTYLAALARRVPGDQRSALIMTTIYNNSGNYGLPLQGLAFSAGGQGALAQSLQVFVMVTQNITSFTVGVVLAASGRRKQNWRQNLLHIAKLPPIYVLAAALATTWVRSLLGEHAPTVEAAVAPFWNVLLYVKDAFIGVALLTLGAQIATFRAARRSGDAAAAAGGAPPTRFPVATSVVLRLLIGPAVGLGIIYAFGLHGLLAQMLLVSTSTPTAINCMLLCLEFDNHPDFAARTVMYSTLLSPLTITLVVFLAQSGLLPDGQGGGDSRDGPAAATTRDTKETRVTRKTVVSIEGDSFRINGRRTYQGRSWRGMSMEGLLMNARLVQGVFDDRNPETRSLWAYGDGPWDPDRNVREFLAAMPAWRAHGLLGFTINLQGGSPRGYSQHQPWYNSAFEVDGKLRADYCSRMRQVLDRADELGMVAIVGVFYFGQEYRLTDEQSVAAALDATVDWLLAEGYTNILVEIANEVDVPRYRWDIVKPPRVHELIQRVRQRSAGKLPTPAGRLLVSTSMGGGTIPPANIVAASDFLLLHGNGVGRPDGIREMVDRCRSLPAYAGQPILFNEDDHFDFDRPDNNMIAAVSRRAGWGYFDYRMAGEGFPEGYQSVPTDWGINSARKRGFFRLLAEMTGAEEGRGKEKEKEGSR